MFVNQIVRPRLFRPFSKSSINKNAAKVEKASIKKPSTSSIADKKIINNFLNEDESNTRRQTIDILKAGHYIQEQSLMSILKQSEAMIDPEYENNVIEIPNTNHYVYEVKFPNSKYWCIMPINSETPVSKEEENDFKHVEEKDDTYEQPEFQLPTMEEFMENQDVQRALIKNFNQKETPSKSKPKTPKKPKLKYSIITVCLSKKCLSQLLEQKCDENKAQMLAFNIAIPEVSTAPYKIIDVTTVTKPIPFLSQSLSWSPEVNMGFQCCSLGNDR